jgi:hypothetical protein
VNDVSKHLHIHDYRNLAQAGEIREGKPWISRKRISATNENEYSRMATRGRNNWIIKIKSDP